MQVRVDSDRSSVGLLADLASLAGSLLSLSSPVTDPITRLSATLKGRYAIEREIRRGRDGQAAVVRLGEPEDSSFIASYHVLAGDRARDIKDGRLYVYEKDARPVRYPWPPPPANGLRYAVPHYPAVTSSPCRFAAAG